TPLLHRFLSARVSGARGGALRRRAHRIPGPYPVLSGVGRTALRCGDDRRGGGGRSGGRGGARRAPVGGAAGGGRRRGGAHGDGGGTARQPGGGGESGYGRAV